MPAADAPRFSIRGMFLLTAIVVFICFFFREGNRINSFLSGFGLVVATLILFGLTLYLGSRFSSKPGTMHRVVYVTFVLFVILLFFSMPVVR